MRWPRMNHYYMDEIEMSPAYQLSLFTDERLPGIVNVASVPQRSPFRYPGGKTWLVPTQGS